MSIFLFKTDFKSPIVEEKFIQKMKSRISRITEYLTNKISAIIAAIERVSLVIFSYSAHFFTSYPCGDRSRNGEIKTDNNNELNNTEELTTDKQAEDDNETLEVDLEEVKSIEESPEEVSLINQASSAPSLLDDLLDQWITRGNPGENRREAANRIKQFAANENNDDGGILDLSGLRLKILPRIFTNTDECFINRMMYLNLRDNQLKNIPKDFGKLKNLKTLDLQKNPLIKIPIEVMDLAYVMNCHYLNISRRYFEEKNSSERLILLADQIDMPDVSDDRYSNTRYFDHYSNGFFYIEPPMFRLDLDLYLDHSNRTVERMTYYDTASTTLISEALKILNDRAKNAHNETECFNLLLNLFVEGRRAIATESESINSILFGFRRDELDIMTTPLWSFPYAIYGERFCSFILESLKKKEELGEEAIPYEKRFDPIDGYSFSYTVNIINCEERKSCLDGRWHDVDPKNPNQLIFSSFIEFEGNQIPLSRYILIDHRYFDSNKICPGTIVHQEDRLIQAMLDGPVMRMFTSAILWNKEKGVESLVKTMALFRFFFAHAMPFVRGSAAIGEWLEKALYLHHGFIDFEHEKSRLADLEALTLPLPDYLDEYPKTITGVSE